MNSLQPNSIVPTEVTATSIQFTLRDQHLRLIQVVLQDQTDSHNEVVQTNEWLLHPSERIGLKGNLFVIENTLTGIGRVVLKRAPLPHARSTQLQFDLMVIPRRDTGFDFTVFSPYGSDGSSLDGYIDLPYEGGILGRTRALQSYQRTQLPDSLEHRTPRFLSNTWGDRSKDSRICQAFMEKEIDAGARLGVETVQIDDGWQKGKSANSSRIGPKGVWEGFWKTQPDFWTPDPVKFPNGLEPLVQQATRHGMTLGLWYAADSADDFAQWEKDAECLTRLHNEYGITHFKIDSIHAPNDLAQERLNHMFTKLLRDTEGQVVCDLDVTAQLRPGYFGLLGTGPLFIENRYSDGHSYWPHQTLRNLWQLTWWVDPGRLRMEMLNHTRNCEKYPNDPLAPSCYAPDALFATVFFSNPLGWFEVSNLPPSYFDKIAPLVKIWKSLRGAVFSGTIMPLGKAPDGVAWTGFASVADDGRSAVVLVFRELNLSADWQLTVPGLRIRDRCDCEVIAGDGQAHWKAEGIQISISSPLGWVLLRLTA